MEGSCGCRHLLAIIKELKDPGRAERKTPLVYVIVRLIHGCSFCSNELCLITFHFCGIFYAGGLDAETMKTVMLVLYGWCVK